MSRQRLHGVSARCDACRVFDTSSMYLVRNIYPHFRFIRTVGGRGQVSGYATLQARRVGIVILQRFIGVIPSKLYALLIVFFTFTLTVRLIASRLLAVADVALRVVCRWNAVAVTAFHSFPCRSIYLGMDLAPPLPLRLLSAMFVFVFEHDTSGLFCPPSRFGYHPLFCF